MHFLTLSWDNGFQKSSLKTAEIFEKFGLRAVETKGDVINPLRSAQTVKLTIGFSEEAEAWLDHSLRRLMALPEGWGPLRISHPDIGKTGHITRFQDSPGPRDSGFGKTAYSFCIVRLRVNGL